MRIVLASASPRRKELLSVITNNFEIITASVDERLIEEGILKSEGDMLSKSQKLVLELSQCKAQAVFDKIASETSDLSDLLIIGSDTCVVTRDEIMGKPVDKEDARRILSKLSLEEHYVLTGVSIITAGKVESFYETSLVRFNALDDYQKELIEEYISTDEPYDKAGAYGIQGNGMLLISGIEGDYYNIMGLPVASLAKRLKKYI